MRDIYYCKPVDNSRLVAVDDPGAVRRCFSISLLAALLFTACLLSAWQTFECMQYGYRIERLQAEKQQKWEANRKLRLEEAALGDPVRIETIARVQLGMTNPTTGQRILIEPAPGSGEPSVVARARRGADRLISQAKNVAVAVP